MTNSTQRNYLGWTLIAGAGLMVIALMASLFKPQPERFTELYFDQPAQLPSVWADRPVTFAFHVRNVENQNLTYHYQVLEGTGSGPQQVVKTGQLALTNGSSQDVPVQLALQVAKTRTEVTVWLPDQQQQIHFWIGA